MEDLYNIYGPRNSHWVEKYISETLKELNIVHVTDKIKKVIENVLVRQWPIAPGCNIGLLIAFELSKNTSQAALDSGHILNSMMNENSESIPSHVLAFEKCLSFTGILSQRKSKEVVFMHADLKKAPWPMIKPAIFVIPMKNLPDAITLATKIYFITQPYEFENEFTAFISSINMYTYMAIQENLTHLLPFFHILALVSCKKNIPISFNRHGLKRRGADFLRRMGFEDILSAISDGSLNFETVSSESIVGALVTSSKSNFGCSYFDLFQKRDL